MAWSVAGTPLSWWSWLLCWLGVCRSWKCWSSSA